MKEKVDTRRYKKDLDDALIIVWKKCQLMRINRYKPLNVDGLWVYML